ncbi:MAG: hypothetical protein F9K35_01270 [Burkholderiaceae bacterium]|nr:MAG: hypothetical protein F9K35_01270 [Burkholderiaceae bacterium]
MNPFDVKEVEFSPGAHAFFDELQLAVYNLAEMSTQGKEMSSTFTFDLPGKSTTYIFHPLQSYVADLRDHATAIAKPIAGVELTAKVPGDWPGDGLSVREFRGTFGDSKFWYRRGKMFESGLASNTARRMLGGLLKGCWERIQGRVKAAHGPSPANWPDMYRLAWFIRNAISHDDRYGIKDPSMPSATWRGTTVGPGDDGKDWWGFDPHQVGPGDLLRLAVELGDGPRLP